MAAPDSDDLVMGLDLFKSRRNRLGSEHKSLPDSGCHRPLPQLSSPLEVRNEPCSVSRKWRGTAHDRGF